MTERDVRHWTCDTSGCGAEHARGLDDQCELPPDWLRLGAHVGDEACIGQDEDMNGEPYLYFCPGCRVDVLNTLCAWSTPRPKAKR